MDMEIKNDWDKAIIFKMKTTQPDAFKMKPVYGIIQPREKKKVLLILKKWDANKKAKKSDHFTVVFAAAPEKCTNAAKVWKAWKQGKLTEASIGASRRQLKIIYNLEPKKAEKKTGSKEEVKKAMPGITKKPEEKPPKDMKEKEMIEKAQQPKKEEKPKKAEKEAEKGKEKERKEKKLKEKEREKEKEKEREKEEEKEEEEEEEERKGKKPAKREKKKKEEEEEEEEEEEDEEDEGQEKRRKKKTEKKVKKDEEESSEDSSDDSE